MSSFYDSYLTWALSYISYITPEIWTQIYFAKINSLVKLCNTIEKYWHFMKKECFDCTEQIFNQRYFCKWLQNKHKKCNYFAMFRAWNLKQLCGPDFGLQWMCWCSYLNVPSLSIAFSCHLYVCFNPVVTSSINF